MSAQEHLAPYLNRFILLLQQQAKARLVIACNEGKLHINITPDIGEVYETSETVPKSYTDVLNKNIRQSQLERL